jgi:D-glycero-D-manno-heptose 1,7-bisphosphate phosphatase
VFRYIRGESGATRRPALFLDRDGVLNRRNVDGYVIEADDFELLDIALDAAATAQLMGAALVVVTNQGCVSTHRATEHQVMAIHALLLTELAERGIVVDAVYACPHHPQAQDPARRDCECRKPKPGLIIAAERDLNLDLASSMLIGDQPSDIAAARAAGIPEDRTLLVGGAEQADPTLFVRRCLAAPTSRPGPARRRRSADPKEVVR